MSADSPRPLEGTTVLDASRMLPGAVLARMLLDMGARLIKVEQPEGGDPMRLLPPRVGGVGAGFCAFFRGAQSVGLDLRRPRDAAILRQLAGRADVLVESFRPGTLEAWGVGPAALQARHPALVICSLSGFGAQRDAAARVGHDINFVATAGLLAAMPGGGLPGVQIADVTAALLACSAVLAALLARQRTGRGTHLDQPLAAGPLPLVTLAMADAAAGEDSTAATLLSGACPAYRLYRCGDGRDIAVGALEPKFWAAFADALGLPEVASAGLDPGAAGREAARQVEEKLGSQPREHWLALARARQLPVTAVHDLRTALAELQEAGLTEETPAPGGGTLTTPGPYVPSVGATPRHPAPRLGEHTASILREFGIADRPEAG